MAEPDPMVQVEAAIMARLGATADDVSTDPQLAALLPGGLHSRSAGGTDFPYLNLQLVRMAPDYTLRRAYRYRFLYNVMVTDMGESIDAASAALERVYDLLQDAGPAELPMEDFAVIYCRRGDRTSTSPTIEGQSTQRLAEEYRIEVVPNG